MKNSLINSLVLGCCLSFATLTSSFASVPSDALVDLLEAEGGIATGNNSDDGYFIVVMGFSDESNENKAYELARLSALKQLNEFVNGSTTSGYSAATMRYDNTSSGEESNSESFVSVVENSFKGAIVAAKVIKKGRYSTNYFVSLALTQNDVALQSALKGSGKQNSKVQAIAQKVDTGIQTIEAKGLASMKDGKASARELAIQNALRNAVQQAQGVMLSGRSGVFGEALNSAISTKTQGYVHSYEIIDEEKSRGDYLVSIVAEVDTAPLLNDIDFYLDILNTPVFYVEAKDKSDSLWLTNYLENMGFILSTKRDDATHVFKIEKIQQVSQSHQNKAGITTKLSVTFENIMTGEIVFTAINNVNKSAIYIAPQTRAINISKKMAYKDLGKSLSEEIITSLARIAEQGVLYPFIVSNANRLDWRLIRHTLENAGTGVVDGFTWVAEGKTLQFNYRYSGSLSRAMDEVLEPLYTTFKAEGKGHRLKALKIGKTSATFEILR
jgi:hypothetical protein|tara:strand:- start:28872 stop:30365 length:1494 start_codon:yes stop_codon:yes gene_type:complete